jgi:hypothetical protein
MEIIAEFIGGDGNHFHSSEQFTFFLLKKSIGNFRIIFVWPAKK